MEFWNDKQILITGGTGSLGKRLVKNILKKYPQVGKIVIYSRDEQKQFLMAQEYPSQIYPQLKFVIGDVRDSVRIAQATVGIDYVIHAAAMKHVHLAEFNPNECVKTNINGAQNVINACLNNNVKRVVALSTDKACAPINLYGATKLVSDKLFVAANNIADDHKTRFSVVRYGNVMGSNGSVIPFFKERIATGTLPITSPEMTRFNISLDEGVEMVLHALENAWGGEIFIPKIKSYRIMDVAEAICEDCNKEIVGIRPGEKIHEEMITVSDSINTYDLNYYYAILPFKPVWSLQKYIRNFNAAKVEMGFSYNSGTNTEWETVESLKNLFSNDKLW